MVRFNLNGGSAIDGIKWAATVPIHDYLLVRGSPLQNCHWLIDVPAA
jgi:hypothetical protein